MDASKASAAAVSRPTNFTKSQPGDKGSSTSSASTSSRDPQRTKSDQTGKPKGGGTTSSAKGGGDRLPAHSEEDLLKGLTLQALWGENVEFTSLMNAALKIARLSPTAPDVDWNDSYHAFLQLFAMSKARLARQKSIMQARQRDLEDILADERSIRQSVANCERAIAEAQRCLAKAKRHRRNREQYEALAFDVSKKATVADLEVAQAEELERKSRAEKRAKLVEDQISTRQRQTQVVLKAASDLLQASQGTPAPVTKPKS
ncbi:hypothetical protein BESB_026140 [Besnoitia besnoiti]|uniref:Tho complex subunit 7 n=1 Tax=Besnoitia besnoiti TaxID=94643 RepID=A0A2A9M8D3_BESBE|nr:uncharacterized protein BESB_026140 [Besnoitia besnoiti]PFH31640.1 hypothetical protein BESB_026140 [Besnoitia besnoiti]